MLVITRSCCVCWNWCHLHGDNRLPFAIQQNVSWSLVSLTADLYSTRYINAVTVFWHTLYVPRNMPTVWTRLFHVMPWYWSNLPIFHLCHNAWDNPTECNGKHHISRLKTNNVTIKQNTKSGTWYIQKPYHPRFWGSYLSALRLSPGSINHFVEPVAKYYSLS